MTMACAKVILRKENKIILGAPGPSPAMSAKRETVRPSRGFEIASAAGEGAAPPVLTGSLQIGSTLWAKPVTTGY